MPITSPVGAAASQPQPSNTANVTNQVDYQTFLKLLVAQMKNQDPLSPMESTEYVAQLATFSQVEQSIQMNRKLEDLLQNTTMSQAASLIGKEIESMDGTVKGTVREVELYTDGIAAILDNGEKVAMSAGVIIREPGVATPPPENDDPIEYQPDASGNQTEPQA